MATGIPLSSLAAGLDWLNPGGGNVQVGAGRQVYVYQRGNTTQVPVFSDQALLTPLAQPLTTDLNGYVPGFVAGERQIDFVDAASGQRQQAEPLAVGDLIGSDGKIAGPGALGVSSAGLPASVAGVTRYLLPSGGDDSAAVASALTSFAPYVSPHVMLGPGVFQWNTQVPAFLRSQAARVQGAGVGKTTIQLSATAPRAFDFSKVADYDSFNGIEMSDFTVDCNSVGGRHHVVIGTYVGGATTTRISVNRFSAKRIRTINVPSDSTLTNHRLNLWIVPSVGAADTLCTLYDHAYEDLDFLQGGNMGLVVGATTTNANCQYQRISVKRYKHDTGLVGNTTHFTSSNLQIGSNAYGTDVTVDEIYGAHSGDVGLEIDNCADANIGTMHILDCITSALLPSNIGWTVGSSQLPVQVTRVGSIRHTAISSLTAGTTGVTIGTSTNPYGKIICGSIVTEMLGTSLLPPLITSNFSCQAFEADHVQYSIPFANDTTSAATLAGAFSLKPSANMRFAVGSYVENLAGVYSTKAYIGPLYIQDSTAAQTLELDIGHVTINDTMTWSSRQSAVAKTATRLINLKITGRIAGVNVIACPTVTSGGIYLQITSAAANLPPWFNIDQCNFTGLAGIGSGEIYVDNNGTVDSSMLRLTRIIYQNGALSAAVTPAVGASPYTYTNNTGKDGTLYLYGGTVSSVTTRSGSQVAASSPCMIRLPSGGAAVITYTVAPTVRFIPDI